MVKRILVADDDQAIVALIKAILAEPEYLVRAVEDGREAVEIAAKELPDVILMDAHLRRVDGYEACRQIRAHPETAHIPVVFVASPNQPSEVQLAFEVGAEAFITKPFNREDLLGTIERVLAERE